MTDRGRGLTFGLLRFYLVGFGFLGLGWGLLLTYFNVIVCERLGIDLNMLS